MTAYLTECIVGLLAMAALFVWVGKNDPMVNDATIGKRFTIGASVYHSDWEGRGVGQDTSSTGHKKPGAGPGGGVNRACTRDCVIA